MKEYVLNPILHTIIVLVLPLFYFNNSIFNSFIICWLIVLFIGRILNINYKSIYLNTLLFILVIYIYSNFFYVKELRSSAFIIFLFLFIIFLLPVFINELTKSSNIKGDK